MNRLNIKRLQITSVRNKKQGFSLVELVVAIAIFAVLMLLVTGLIVNGLKVRKGSRLDIEAQTYLYTVFEQFKGDWSNKDKFDKFNAADANNPDPALRYLSYPPQAVAFLSNVPEPFSLLTLDFDCIALDGSVQTPCNNPDLRRIRMSLQDKDNKVRAELMTEIGQPRP